MESKSILVVEDNELNKKLVRHLITKAGYTVYESIDAETGIQLARDHQPDLILMDIQLPGMDGLEAARVIKADPELKHIIIVALTSFAMEGDEQAVIEAGCDGYITKPISTRDFNGRLLQYFNE
jgi:CheY-like chemotaxis protein